MRSKLTMTFALVALFCLNSFAHAQGVQEGEAEVAQLETVAAELAGEEDFETLAAAVKTAGLMEALEGEGPYTLFAPSEEAFKKIGAETLEQLMQPENKEKLVKLLKAHVAAGEWTAEKISGVSEIPTADGGSLTVSQQGEKLMVGSATIDPEKCIDCENGMIHCIDEVLTAK